MKAEATEKQTIWEERVRAWQASGVSARKFAETSGLSVSSLRYWSYRLRSSSEALRVLRLVPKEAQGAVQSGSCGGPEVVPGRPATPPPSQLTVEVGAARVVVHPGFDRRLLAEVVVALSGGAA
jgi:hypothetical protein